MKNIFWILVLAITFVGCTKEKGCTDATATNYSATAEEDDGSCIVVAPETAVTTTTSSNSTTGTTGSSFVGTYQCTANGATALTVKITESSGTMHINIVGAGFSENITGVESGNVINIDSCMNICYGVDENVARGGTVTKTSSGRVKLYYGLYDPEYLTEGEANWITILED